jgi:putative spermidine/putrescine transport system permease protein
MAATTISQSRFSGGIPWRTYLKALRSEVFSLALVIALFIIIIGPMLTVILWAFADRWRYPSLLPTQWGLTFWADTLSRADVTSAFPLSIALAVTVTFLSAVVCLPAAFAFARMNFPGRQGFLLSFLAVNAFPRFGLYVSIAVVFYLVGTIPGVILIQIVNTLLLMMWIPTSAFQGVDRSLEEAALDVGASRVRVFLQVTLPLVLPALAAAILLTFVSTFYEAQGALIVGLPEVRTMAVLMYSIIVSQVVVQYGSIISFILWLPSLILLIFAQRFVRGNAISAGFGV